MRNQKLLHFFIGVDRDLAKHLRDNPQFDPYEWGKVLRSVSTHMKKDNVNIAAGAFAYRWFLSIFPVVIALLGVASLVTFPRGLVVRLIDGVTTILPTSAATVLASATSHAAHTSSAQISTIVVAGLVAIWSATSGMVIVQEGLDMAYETPNSRSFVRSRIDTIPLLLGALILGGAASALAIFGSQLGSLVENAVPLAKPEFYFAWTALRWFSALALINLLFTILYTYGPNRSETKWHWGSPGALFGTLLWAVISFGFSLYTSNIGSYGSTYGAFAGVAILIFWLYLSGLAILIGGEVNSAFKREEGELKSVKESMQQLP